MDLLFDWNDQKAGHNLRNHGVDFEDAVTVWNDVFRDEWLDEREAYGEDRWVTVGMTSHGMLTVVSQSAVLWKARSSGLSRRGRRLERSGIGTRKG